SVDTLREIVEDAKVESPLDRSLAFACCYTKHSQELLEYVFGTCPKVFNQQDKKHAHTPRKKQVTFEDQITTSSSTTYKHVEPMHTQKSNVPVPPSTGVNGCTDASGSQPRSILKKHRILPAKSDNLKKVEDHPRTIRYSLKTTNRVDSSIISKRTVINSSSHSVCQTGVTSFSLNRFAQLMNDLERNNMKFLAVSINTKFLNSLQPEWLKYVGKVYDLRTLVAHTGSSSSSETPSSYYVTNPSSVVDYDEVFEEGLYYEELSKPRVHDSKYFMEQMLLAKQDEVGVILSDEQNDFLFADASRMEEIEELSANICLMARIQPTDQNSNDEPSYESAFVSEVQSASINENDEQDILETKSMPSELPLINELFNIKVGFEKLFLLIKQNSKRASMFYTSTEEIALNNFCRDQVKPLLNELLDYFDGFQNLFQRDIKEMKDAFEQNDVYLDEIERQNDLLKDQLLEASLKHDIELCVLLNHECVDKTLHDELEQVKKKSLEIQEGLKARIKILEKNKLEDDNVSLDFKVQSLIKEQDNAKMEYKKLFDSIKKTRSQTQKEMDELIAHVSEKTYAYGAIRAENQNLLSTISELKARMKNSENGKSVNTKFDKTNGSQSFLCVTPLNKNAFQKQMVVSKTKENHVESKPVTLQTSPHKQIGANQNTNVIRPGMYRVVTTQESQTNKTKSVLSSTGMNATSSVRRPLSRDSHVKNIVLDVSKNAAKKEEVYVRKNKQTDNTFFLMLTSNKENVFDVMLATLLKRKLCSSEHSKLELLHMDLCGPMRVASINGKKYILVIVDEFSRYTWVYFLRSKDETLQDHQEIHCSTH
ncbi:integrase, catalytic region, zinc finger, CCHC-type containing protein, partial [Tanacetum coccineum]